MARSRNLYPKGKVRNHKPLLEFFTLRFPCTQPLHNWNQQTLISYPGHNHWTNTVMLYYRFFDIQAHTTGGSHDPPRPGPHGDTVPQ